VLLRWEGGEGGGGGGFPAAIGDHTSNDLRNLFPKLKKKGGVSS
jgi:hypothetical protein